MLLFLLFQSLLSEGVTDAASVCGLTPPRGDKTGAFNTQKSMRKFINIDIMSQDGMYLGTVRYEHPHPPLFILDIEELRRYVIGKRPTLRNVDFKLLF